MRQRALSSYLKDIEDQLESQPKVNVKMNAKKTNGYVETVNRYPFTGISNVTTPISQGDHTGFFWQIPRSGGTTLKRILGTCLHLVQASRTSSEVCDTASKAENKLHICKTPLGAFVNCDPSGDQGLQRCREMELVPSGLADVVVSSRFLNAASLFDPDHQARSFTIMRNPIERMVSTFYYQTQNEKGWKNMTMLEYVKRDDTPSNWMIRYLTGRMTAAKVTLEDLDLAKEILERKFFIMLTKEMEGSVKILIRHMKYKVSDEGKNCIKEELFKVQNHLVYPKVDMESEAIDLLKQMNELDIALYAHAVKLFSRQWINAVDVLGS